ncbi:hypothetical protein L596_015912 [Steinernema carpocapsae]|uniref:Uncharacterized protein n=1 Tax=Steinernema carpocapsae TaxID=34508 RepID=A0A4U5NHF1_STECR|nr:hypothetical protein L596_015912 [Steinernema carpocapsae]
MLSVRTFRVLAFLVLSFGSFGFVDSESTPPSSEADEVKSKVFKLTFLEKQGAQVREIEMSGKFRRYSQVLGMTQDLKKDGHDWCAFWRQLHKIEMSMDFTNYWTSEEKQDFSTILDTECKRNFKLRKK